ncbi:MAG TPA: ATP-binding protein [Actinospica sp.]|nr:ATP-binding protein [Actinospica sp.]
MSSPPTAAPPRRGHSWRAAPFRTYAGLDSLGDLADYVRSIAHGAALGEYTGLRLAVEELAVNALVHGYGTGHGWLMLTGGGDRGVGFIRLSDTAPPFDPSAAPARVPRGLALRDRPLGGLGIPLALAGVDGYRYEYVDGTNRSTLTVRRRPAGRP